MGYIYSNREHNYIVVLSAAPNSQQMTLISSWPVTEGTRFEGMFRFEVMGTAEPFMETFNVSFGKTVTSFKVGCHLYLLGNILRNIRSRI